MQFDFTDEPKRKAFTIKTKKIEWMKASGHKPELYTEKGIFYKTSKCRNCPRKLTWGDRTYDFDHKDNNPKNNSQKNCYLVCKVCHGKHTVIKKIKQRDPFFGTTIGHKTIKKKVGYKKQKAKKKKRVPAEYDFFGNVIRWKYVSSKLKNKSTKKKTITKKKSAKKKTSTRKKRVIKKPTKHKKKTTGKKTTKRKSNRKKK
jgi:hypothetical protein